jgi:hypothetical protein
MFSSKYRVLEGTTEVLKGAASLVSWEEEGEVTVAVLLLVLAAVVA